MKQTKLLRRHDGFTYVTSVLAFIIPLLITIAFITSCGDGTTSSAEIDEKELDAFNQRIYERRTYLLHEHTYDKANIRVADSILAESEKLNSDYGRMVALQIKYYVYVADTAKGEEFVNTIDEFLRLAKKTDSKDDYFDAMNAKVYYYIENQKYVDALYMVRETLKEAETTRDSIGLYFSNYMMANIYENRGDFAISIPYYSNAEKYVKGDSLKTALVNRGLSFASNNLGKNEEALERAELSMRYAPTTVHRVWAEHQYLVCLYGLNRKKDFLDYWKKSYIRTHDVNGVLPNYMVQQLKVCMSIYKSDYDGAVKYANQIEYPQVRNNELLEIYKAMGDFKKAYDMRNTIEVEKDSVQSLMKVEDLNEMEARLGNSLLKLESEKLQQRNQYIIFVSIIVVLVVISFFIGIISYRNHKHLRELDAKNQQLIQANQIAESASEAKSVFIGNVSHELNTPLNHVYGFAQMITDDSIVSTVEEYKEMAQYICDGSNQLKHIIDNITEVSDKLAKLTKLEDVESVLKFNDTLDNEPDKNE